MAGEVTAQSILEDSSCCVLEGVQLNELIGSGSYAKVYKGSWKGTKVAVKQLHEIFSDSDVEPQQKGGLLGTFYKELSMNVRLRHPNIIQFLGVVAPSRPAGNPQAAGRRGQDGGGGFPMMVMELMHCTLEKRLEEYREAGTRMPLCKTIDIASDIVAALVYLHGQEPQPIAHRDLAPKNVLLSAEDTAKLCDLGVAKLAHGSMNNTRGPGTLPYMPPEVLIGTHYAPTAVDIYSFGVALLEMCSGLEPKPKGFVQMAGESEGMLCQMVPERERRAASFSALPPKHPLETTILKCLELKAENRPTAEQLLSTLLEMKEGEAYKESKTNTRKASCPACSASKAEIHLLHLQLEEQSRELLRLLEENKTLKKFRDEQLRSLNLQLQATAEEGHKYQRRLQEMQQMLLMQEQMNHELEASNDRAMYFNKLLKHKVEMDNNPSRFSNPPPKPTERVKPCNNYLISHPVLVLCSPKLCSFSPLHCAQTVCTKVGGGVYAVAASVCVTDVHVVRCLKPLMPVFCPGMLHLFACLSAQGVHSGSVKCTAEQRPKPVPKPRKRMSAVFISGEESNGQDLTLENASSRSSVPPLTRVSSDPELVSRQQNNYLELIAGTPESKPRAVPIDRVPSHLEKQRSSPTLSRSGGAVDYTVPLVTLTKPGGGGRVNPATVKPGVNHEASTSKIPIPNGRHRPTKAEGGDDLEGHIYVEIPPKSPPTPPPRMPKRFDLHRATWHAAPSSRPKHLGPIAERDESLASPHPTVSTPDWARPVRMVQSMKIKGGPFRVESQNLVHDTPSFSRQGSRGDVLISRVLSTVKSRVSMAWS